jgi:Holliday junction resolvasome RuvABC endonuclease subunit
MGADLSPTMFGAPSRRRSRNSPGIKRAPKRQRPGERAATGRLPDFDAIAPAGTRVLGVDLGLNLGWAILDERGRRISSGTLRLGRVEVQDRARVARTRLRELITDLAKPTAIAYERVRRHEGTEAAHVYGGLMWTLESVVPRGVRLETVEVAAVKQAATGKGNADKEAVIAAAGVKWARQGAYGPDEADALWIAEVMRRRCSG